MEKQTRFYSEDKLRFIDVLRSDDGHYRLQQYEEKFDDEEEVAYVVRVVPAPKGVFVDCKTAKKAAQEFFARR